MEKRSYYNAGHSYLVTHPGTIPDEQGSTLLSRRDVVLSLWYSDSECIVISKMRKGNREKKVTDICWVNEKRKMRGMKLRIITLLWRSNKKQGLRIVT